MKLLFLMGLNSSKSMDQEIFKDTNLIIEQEATFKFGHSSHIEDENLWEKKRSNKIFSVI